MQQPCPDLLRLAPAEHPAFSRRLDAASDGTGDERPAGEPEKMGYGQRLSIDAVTGLINAIVSLPVMCSFAVIIFDVSSFFNIKNAKK